MCRVGRGLLPAILGFGNGGVLLGGCRRLGLCSFHWRWLGRGVGNALIQPLPNPAPLHTDNTNAEK